MKILLSVVLLFFLSCTTVSDKPKVSDEKKASSHYNMGVAKMNSNDLGKARRELELAVQFAPHLAFYRDTLALVYMAMKDYKKAEETLILAYKIDNTYTNALNTLGVLRLKQGRLVEAEKLFKRVLEDAIYPYPQYPEINLGIIARMRKQYDVAEEHFSTALSYKKQECRARKEMGKLYDEQGLREKAAFNYGLSLKYCRDDVETLYRSAVVYMILKQEKKGMKSLKNCVLIAAQLDDPSKIPFLSDCLRLAKQYGATAEGKVPEKRQLNGTKQ